MQDMADAGILPDVDAYTSLLLVVAGDAANGRAALEDAESVIEEMQGKGTRPSRPPAANTRNPQHSSRVLCRF